MSLASAAVGKADAISTLCDLGLNGLGYLPCRKDRDGRPWAGALPSADMDCSPTILHTHSCLHPLGSIGGNYHEIGEQHSLGQLKQAYTLSRVRPQARLRACALDPAPAGGLAAGEAPPPRAPPPAGKVGQTSRLTMVP